jgi:hypothetical protein
MKHTGVLMAHTKSYVVHPCLIAQIILLLLFMLDGVVIDCFGCSFCSAGCSGAELPVFVTDCACWIVVGYYPQSGLHI